MIDCNIHDGDVIIIERYENCKTAVVMINNQEVTLKKLYIEKSGVRLQSAKPGHATHLSEERRRPSTGSDDGRHAPTRPHGLMPATLRLPRWRAKLAQPVRSTASTQLPNATSYDKSICLFSSILAPPSSRASASSTNSPCCASSVLRIADIGGAMRR